MADSNGNLYAVFNQGGNKTFFTKSTDGGVTWSTPLDITSTANNNDKNAAITVDSSGNIHVVIDQNNDNIYYRRSTNGGTSFSSAVQIDTNLAANSNDRLPDIAVSGSNVYVVFNQNNNRTYFVRSTNSGSTWATAIETTSIAGGNNDKNAAIAVDSNGNIHLVIDQNNENVYYRKSTNSGSTFSTGVQIDTARAADSKDRFPKITVDSNNTLHVVFNQNNASTFYVKSSDGGATWATALDLSTGSTDKNAAITVDNSGKIYVAIDDNNDNVSVRQSTNGGISFSRFIDVDTTIGDGANDRNPSIVATSSAVHVLFGQNGQNVFATRLTLPAGTGSTTTSISASPTLVVGGDGITIRMTLNSSSAVSNVAAGALSVVNQTGGANATSCSAATLVSADTTISGPSDPVIYQWTCTAQAGTSPGSVSFRANATGTGGTFAQATSNSVLVSPILSYKVTVVNPAISQLSQIDNIASIKSDTVIPFTNSNKVTTLLPTGSIGDFIFYDNPANPNGLPDGGEAGVAGATVTLYKMVNGQWQLYALQITSDGTQDVDGNGSIDPVGYYNFTGLPAGEYDVAAESQTVAKPGTNPAVYGTMISTSGEHKEITLATGQVVTNADFGFIEAALLEGHVFHDVNSNGVLDGSEPRLEFVTVELLNSSGVVVQTAVTDDEGEYHFLVAPGDYTVRYVTTDPDIPSTLTKQTTPTSIMVANVTAGSERADLDFGLDNPGTIGDLVWLDSNGNATKQSGEPGLQNITVELYTGSTVNVNNLLDVTATDANGNYLFIGLPDGPYTVRVIKPSGYTDTTANPQIATVNAAGGSPNFLTADFGLNVATVTLSGRVYNDQNNNGDDNGEPGFANVDVTVICNGTTYTTQTTATGAWSLSIPSASNCTAISVDGSDVPGVFQPKEVATPPGTVNSNVTDLDFGFVSNPGSISGTVCVGGGDGQCNIGETVLTNVTITLRYAGSDGILGTADDVVTPQQTNGSGTYSFPNLAPGLYQITETTPAGYTSVADADGGNPDSITVTLAFGQIVIKRDFEESQNFVAQPNYVISKKLNTPDPVRKGELISFTIRITNTGNVTITTLPLRDVYADGIMPYIGATPAPDNPQRGQLTWTDLTQSGASGFGRDLGPGQVFMVVVSFTAGQDTSGLPGGATTNTATVEGALYDPSGNGTQPPTGPLPTKSAQATVRIFAATAVALADYAVSVDEAGVSVHWQTVDESNIAYFNLYRVNNGERTLVTTREAQKAGQPVSALYEYRDSEIQIGKLYEYRLDVYGLDNTQASISLGTVLAGKARIFLPSLTR